MKRLGTSEQQLHVEVYPQKMLRPQFRKSTVFCGTAVYGIAVVFIKLHITAHPALSNESSYATAGMDPPYWGYVPFYLYNI